MLRYALFTAAVLAVLAMPLPAQAQRGGGGGGGGHGGASGHAGGSYGGHPGGGYAGHPGGYAGHPGGYGGYGHYGYGRYGGYGYGYGGFGYGFGYPYGWGYGFGYGYGAFYDPWLAPRILYAPDYAPGYGYPAPDSPYAPLPPTAPYATQQPPSLAQNRAQVQVLLPDPDALVWFDGTKTSSTGSRRLFDPPALQPGVIYTYRVAASWTQNGKVVTDIRVASVTGGRTTVIDFTRPPSPEPLGPPNAVKD